MTRATLATLLEKNSPFSLEDAKFLLGFENKSEIPELHELQQNWSSFEKEHRYMLLHGFLDGESAEDMLDDWYRMRKNKPLPIPKQQIHKVKNEIYAKTKRYVIRLMYLRLRTGTYIDPYTQKRYPAQKKKGANQIIWGLISPTDRGLNQKSIALATQGGRFL